MPATLRIRGTRSDGLQVLCAQDELSLCMAMGLEMGLVLHSLATQSCRCAAPDLLGIHSRLGWRGLPVLLSSLRAVARPLQLVGRDHGISGWTFMSVLFRRPRSTSWRLAPLAT